VMGKKKAHHDHHGTGRKAGCKLAVKDAAMEHTPALCPEGSGSHHHTILAFLNLIGLRRHFAAI